MFGKAEAKLRFSPFLPSTGSVATSLLLGQSARHRDEVEEIDNSPLPGEPNFILASPADDSNSPGEGGEVGFFWASLTCRPPPSIAPGASSPDW